MDWGTSQKMGYTAEKEKALKPLCFKAFLVELIARFELATSSLPILFQVFL
jgi:hypothetical protein